MDAPSPHQPEFTQCLSCKPQPECGVRGDLDELVFFSRSKIIRYRCIKWISPPGILSTVVWEEFLKKCSEGRDVFFKTQDHCASSQLTGFGKVDQILKGINILFIKSSAVDLKFSSECTDFVCLDVCLYLEAALKLQI